MVHLCLLCSCEARGDREVGLDLTEPIMLPSAEKPVDLGFELGVKVDPGETVQDRGQENQKEEERTDKNLILEVYLEGKCQEVHEDEGDPGQGEDYHVPDVAQVQLLLKG
jgi:hypothetical protein